VSPHNPPHAFVVYLANRVLSRRFASTFAVLCQLPVRVPQHGMPEPDVMVLRPGSVRRDRLPDAADALLLVEVADSSLDADLQRKLPLYARAAVPELWVIEVRREVIRVFTEPRQGHYTAETEVARADRLHPRFSPEAALAAESFFAEDVDR
jgi:Uma2 family endonuclease